GGGASHRRERRVPPAGGRRGAVRRAELREPGAEREASQPRSRGGGGGGGRGGGVTFFLWTSAIKVVVVFTAVMVGVAFLTWVERRVCAWIQDRLGPNRVGPEGLLQPAADGLKNLFKEETLPASSDKLLFLLAPAMSFVPALLTI